ncbi:di-heme oxidoredictase family protein [Mesorhizobium sp. M0208]|uniref:di-heme oxidoredictase family protein n=1 Tax=Mesorhizobium sp. M0208 TaxID=2956916 RepID=UPI00333DE8EF
MADKANFEDVEEIKVDPKDPEKKGGLGPVYNATSCVSCHQNPVTGSSSQISEIRAGGKDKDGNFAEPFGGSLIHQRAIDGEIQEHVLADEVVRTLRMSTNTLGDGFVEVIPDSELIANCESQKGKLRGLPIARPVAVRVKAVNEAGQPKDFDLAMRVGRFGWKDQHASLLNFSADAYINEMGITSPLQPTENSSNGQNVSSFDRVDDPEDKATSKDPAKIPVKHEDFEHPFGEDVEAFAEFMRSTGVPPARIENADVLKRGEEVFDAVNCVACHRKQYTTPPAGSLIVPLFPKKAGAIGTDFAENKVPEALGGKVIRPFSDFLMHNIGTGDGIVQAQHAQLPAIGVESFLIDRVFREAPDFFSPDVVDKLKELTGIEANVTVPAGDACHPKVVLPQNSRLMAESFAGRRSLRDVKIDQTTANMIRTAPLWGLRLRPQMLHDGRALTIRDAILAHHEDAQEVTDAFNKLSGDDVQALLAFLNSL